MVPLNMPTTIKLYGKTYNGKQLDMFTWHVNLKNILKKQKIHIYEIYLLDKVHQKC